MITTECEQCCFFRRDDKKGGCVLKQLCVTQDNKTFAPGYCRMCRSKKWHKNHGTDLSILSKMIIEENVLKFDMLIFFDETTNNITDLERTLNSDWYVPYTKKIVIADVTGFGNRKNIAMQYLNSGEYHIPINVDSSVVHEPTFQREKTIYRLSKQITAQFFLVIPAGNILTNVDLFAKNIQYGHHLCSRVIHWSFPYAIGGTPIISYKLHHGLFITKPYKALMKIPNIESFTDQLKREEIETQIRLSWSCENCWIT